MHKPINGWTKASIIKHIEENFLGRSTDSSGDCVYNDGHGRKCAVGIFIPSQKYHTEMEGAPAKVVIKEYGLSDDMPLEPTVMNSLQVLHDFTNGIKSDTDIKESLIQFIQNNVEE